MNLPPVLFMVIAKDRCEWFNADDVCTTIDDAADDVAETIRRWGDIPVRVFRITDTLNTDDVTADAFAVIEARRNALRGDYINSLPQPFYVRLYGGKDWWWPVNDIGIDVPLLRIDVCGKLQVVEFSDVAEIKDDAGDFHNPDDWRSDAAPGGQP